MIMEIAGEPSTGVAEMTTVEMATVEMAAAEMVTASEVATIKVAAHASGAKMPAAPAHTEAAAAATMAAPTASATPPPPPPLASALWARETPPSARTAATAATLTEIDLFMMIAFPKRAVSARSGEALTAPIRRIYEARGEAALAILLPFTQICGGRRQGL